MKISLLVCTSLLENAPVSRLAQRHSAVFAHMPVFQRGNGDGKREPVAVGDGDGDCLGCGADGAPATRCGQRQVATVRLGDNMGMAGGSAGKTGGALLISSRWCCTKEEANGRPVLQESDPHEGGAPAGLDSEEGLKKRNSCRLTSWFPSSRGGSVVQDCAERTPDRRKRRRPAVVHGGRFDLQTVVPQCSHSSCQA
jgi:hypothetical protein